VQLVNMLNRAQRIAASKLAPFMVPELVNSATEQATGDASGFDLTGLDPDLFNGQAGIISVKHSGGHYCRFLTEAERQEDSDNQVTYVYADPVYWIIGQTMYVNPYSGYTFDITYKAEPTDMAVEKLHFTYAASDPAATTTFVGDDSQGLSAVNSAYNGAILYLRDKLTFHRVTGYVGASRTFTVSPAAATSISAAGTFDFDESVLRKLAITSGVSTSCALSTTVQDIMLEIAEGRALKGINNRASIQTLTYAENLIDEYNAQYAGVEPTRFSEILGLMRPQIGV